MLENWDIEVLDVKMAFLFGELDEEIYMEQPEGFIQKGQKKKVYRLRKAIYGLKQAAVETRTSLCLYSTPFTFHPTALLLSIHSELLSSC